MPSVHNRAPSSEFVSSSIPTWQILTAHAQPFRGARDLAFCLKVPLDSVLIWASSGDSGETARMRRLAWIFAARIDDKYQIRLTRSSRYLTRLVLKHRILVFKLDFKLDFYRLLNFMLLQDSCIRHIRFRCKAIILNITCFSWLFINSLLYKQTIWFHSRSVREIRDIR